jgi:methylmalonyl-CoA/ethylmalonyl-CoA epimerase
MSQSGGIKIDHLGIAVESLDAARRLYESLGLKVAPPETIEHEQVSVAMIPVEGGRIELLEPTSEHSPVRRFLQKRGPGLHHIALQVNDIAATLATLKEQGARLVSDQVQHGAGGHLYFFVHPSSAGGVLLEICQDVAASDSPAEAK